ncbi:MAG: bis(5'-nucleosyl)-tetraphosphatase (symmetrical) YqeK [Firmicutes bacterium]|nr:bis(5'-nucleosyl)-tetraphosphatase (symmetrical) YqeK [Alicyclobacillaceae bacterium]MCL6496968.1 bis(5'-nucleosyl)-tetraphosphatase (symmetrical) YqeK [Bacillota bacterium]
MQADHEWLAQRLAALSPHRRGHIHRVTALLVALAERHGLDRQAGWWAGMGHDLAREMARDALLAEARRLGLAIGPAEAAEPLLLHGPVAAAWLRERGIGGSAAWEAIRYHTTAGPGLGPLAKALFIADGVEPGRGEYPGRADLEALAFRDLDAAYCAVVASSAAYLERRGLTRHPDMAAAEAECQAGSGERRRI